MNEENCKKAKDPDTGCKVQKSTLIRLTEYHLRFQKVVERGNLV